MTANVRLEWVNIDDGMTIIRDVKLAAEYEVSTHQKSVECPARADVVIVKMLSGAIYAKVGANSDSDVSATSGVRVDASYDEVAFRILPNQVVFMLEVA